MRRQKTETTLTKRRSAIARSAMLVAASIALAATKGQADESGSATLDDRSTIMSLLVAYATALDEGRIEDCAALFNDAEFTITDVATVQGSRGVEELFSGIIIYEDGTPRTKHVITNVDITLQEGGQAATSLSYLTVFQQVGDTPLQPIFTGAYSDRFEKVGGTWLFKTRVVSNALFGDMSRHLRNPPN